MAIRSTVVVLFFTVASALAGDTHEDAYLRDVIKDALYFINACGSKDLSLCLKVGADFGEIRIVCLFKWLK